MALSEEMRLAIKITAQDTSKAAFGQLNQNLNGLKGAALAAAAAVGGALAFRDVIATTQRLSTEIDMLKDNFGMTAEQASKTNFALKVVGASAEDFTTAVGFLNKKIIETIPHIGEQTDDFQRWGISILDAKGGLRGTGDILGELREKMQAAGPGQAAMGMAFDLMGRSNRTLTEFMQLTNAEMADLAKEASELGQVLSEAGAKDLKGFNRQVNLMGIAFDGLKLQVGRALLPILRFLFDAFRQGAGIVKAFAEALRAPLGIIKEVIERIRAFVGRVKEADLFGALQSIAEDLITRLGTVLGNVRSWLTTAWPQWKTAVEELWGNFTRLMEDNAPRFGQWILDSIPLWRDNFRILAQDAGSWIVSDFIPTVLEAFATINVKLGAWALAVGSWLVTSALPQISGAAFSIGSGFAEGMLRGLGTLGSRIGAWFNDNVLIPFQTKINELLGAARQLPVIGGFVPGPIDVFRPATGLELPPIDTLSREAQIQYIRNLQQNYYGGGGGPDLIAAQHGGIFTRPTPALIGEAGPEAVIPLSRGGWGPITINVNGDVTRENARELAERVAEQIIRRMRGLGQPGGSPTSPGGYF